MLHSSFYRLLFSMALLDIKEQLTCFVNHCAATQREPGFPVSNSRIPMERIDWPSLGQVAFSDYRLAMVKGKNWFYQHGTSTVTAYYLCVGKTTGKGLIKQVLRSYTTRNISLMLGSVLLPGHSQFPHHLTRAPGCLSAHVPCPFVLGES